MVQSKTESVLENVYTAETPRQTDLEYLLALERPQDLAALFDFADEIRRKYVGNGIILRGIIEFANHCRNTCEYCGLNRNNRALGRYRLSRDVILECAEAVYASGIRTVVLQSGEDECLDAQWLAELVAAIKRGRDVAVTLSVGQARREHYALWRAAGAERYLLKIETSDARLYRRLHPTMSFPNHIRCIEDLIDLDYQTGSGSMVGLPGQSVETIAGDISFFKKYRFDMVSVGPFIPHSNTALAAQPPGDLTMTLKTIALTRIVTRNAHIPANTAIASLNGFDARPQALKAGANVVMLSFTPARSRRLYEIYPSRVSLDTSPADAIVSIERAARRIGRCIDYTRGDSLKLGAEREYAKTLCKQL